MGKCVILLEDDADVAHLVGELLGEAEYSVVHVTRVDDLLREAAVRAPCVALLDSTNPRCFDLWGLGPRLRSLSVPPIAFTAHASAEEEWKVDAHDFVGIVAKPFEAEEFLNIVDAVCWEDHHAPVS